MKKQDTKTSIQKGEKKKDDFDKKIGYAKPKISKSDDKPTVDP